MPQCLAHRYHIVEYEQVGHQMVVLYEFSLFITYIFRNDSVAAESYPLPRIFMLSKMLRKRLLSAGELGDHFIVSKSAMSARFPV